jgi:hypothetical protein
MWTKQNKKKVRILNNLAFQSGAQISSGPRSETLLFEFGPVTNSNSNLLSSRVCESQSSVTNSSGHKTIY